MSTRVLDFERPIVELEGKIRELKRLFGANEGDLATEIERLEAKATELKRERFASLTPWEQLQLAKHPDRPYTLDYIGELTEDFVELHGDRLFSDDAAIVAGLCRFGRRRIVVMGVVVPLAASDEARRVAAYPALGLAVDHLRVESLDPATLPAWQAAGLAAPEA